MPVQRGDEWEYGYALTSPLQHFHQEIDRFFDNAFRGFGLPQFEFDRSLLSRMPDSMLKPSLDLGATDKEYTITVEIPGVDEKDVKLEIVNDTLTIRGEKRHEKEILEMEERRKRNVWMAIVILLFAVCIIQGIIIYKGSFERSQAAEVFDDFDKFSSFLDDKYKKEKGDSLNLFDRFFDDDFFQE